MQIGLFSDDDVKPSGDNLLVLPVSVLEVSASGKGGIRGASDHNAQSSRTGFSPFPWEVAEQCAALYLRNATHVVDPFAGWGERHAACKRHGKRYTGFDTSPDAIANALNLHGVQNTLADSRVVEVPDHDGLLTCPPYWNLEQYAGEGIDRRASWLGFLSDYAAILRRFVAKASAGAVYCIATGDWRDAGVYYDLTFQTERIMHELGMEPFDKVVISRLGISKVKVMIPQAKRLGYTVKVHEMLSVYVKPYANERGE